MFRSHVDVGSFYHACGTHGVMEACGVCYVAKEVGAGAIHRTSILAFGLGQLDLVPLHPSHPVVARRDSEANLRGFNLRQCNGLGRHQPKFFSNNPAFPLGWSCCPISTIAMIARSTTHYQVLAKGGTYQRCYINLFSPQTDAFFSNTSWEAISRILFKGTLPVKTAKYKDNVLNTLRS